MYQPPPFIGTWEQARKGGGKKKKIKKTEKIRSRTIAGQKQSIQKRPSLKHSIVKPKFHKNIPMSNYDLLKWCKYLNIPINNVLSRDESSPHNHMQALFIYNLGTFVYEWKSLGSHICKKWDHQLFRFFWYATLSRNS